MRARLKRGRVAPGHGHSITDCAAMELLFPDPPPPSSARLTTVGDDYVYMAWLTDRLLPIVVRAVRTESVIYKDGAERLNNKNDEFM